VRRTQTGTQYEKSAFGLDSFDRQVISKILTPPRFIFKGQCHIQMAKVEKIHNWANMLARTKLGEDRYSAS
jgi:hypothetical protein